MIKGIWRWAILSILVLTLTPVEWGQDSHSHTSVATPESKWSELVGSMHVMHAAMASVRPSGDNDADFVSAQAGARDHHRPAIRNRVDAALVETAGGQVVDREAFARHSHG